MALSNTHKIPEIQKLLNQLEDEIFSFRITHNEEYAAGIEHCVRKIREIIDTS